MARVKHGMLALLTAASLAAGAAVVAADMGHTGHTEHMDHHQGGAAGVVAGHGAFTPQDFKWQEGPPSLPPGAQVAMLEGNLTESGPFTFRMKLPDGYKVPPHTHPGIEHVTVLSGTLKLGHGDRFDAKEMRTFPAGSFLYMPPQMQHYAMTEGETVIQIHGIGPWGINYINPADDPRHGTAQEK